MSSRRFAIISASAFSLASVLLLGGATRAAEPGAIALDAKALYSGFEARKVVLDKDGGKLLLDARVFQYGKEKEGRVVTDPIDLGAAEGVVGLQTAVTGLGVEVAAEVPDGAAVEVETRSGASFFDQSGWSDWTKLGGLSGKVADLKGRYVQVRLTLKATAADKLPALTVLTLTPAAGAAPAFKGKVSVVEDKLQNIVRSPIDFKYERLDQPKLAKFRQENKLDAVIKDGKDDFEKLVKLMDWVNACVNDRQAKREKDPDKGFYSWDIERVFQLVEVEKDGKKLLQPTIYGHCASYAETMVTAATAMGYAARHMAKEGFRQGSHEVSEIWVPSLGKWVYFDPSLGSYYTDKKTKEKLNLIELHRIIVNNFVPEGKDIAWFAGKDSSGAKSLVKKVGGKSVVDCRLGSCMYGAPMPANYDWGWSHGYMCSGFVQMTPRNDFHSHPEAYTKNLGAYPGYAGYPFWVDEKTNPKKGVSNWFTRMRDFYWTLDQAGVKLVRTGDDEVSVELGNSMPFFKTYALKVDGKEVAGAASPFVWKLKPGENRLDVAPVDEFGKTGAASSVTLKLE